MEDKMAATLGCIEDSLGNREIPLERYSVVICKNGDIKVRYKGSDIVWVDSYYMNGGQPADGGEHQAGLPSIIVNAVGQDEPSVCLSIGDDKVYINDIDYELTEDKRVRARD